MKIKNTTIIFRVIINFMKNSSTKDTNNLGSKPARMTGIAIPLGAIYTKKNTVIGEFTVLPDFAKFCEEQLKK